MPQIKDPQPIIFSRWVCLCSANTIFKIILGNIEKWVIPEVLACPCLISRKSSKSERASWPPRHTRFPGLPHPSTHPIVSQVQARCHLCLYPSLLKDGKMKGKEKVPCFTLDANSNPLCLKIKKKKKRLRVFEKKNTSLAAYSLTYCCWHLGLQYLDQINRTKRLLLTSQSSGPQKNKKPSCADKYRKHLRRGGGKSGERNQTMGYMMIVPLILVATFHSPHVVTNKQTSNSFLTETASSLFSTLFEFK